MVRDYLIEQVSYAFCLHIDYPIVIIGLSVLHLSVVDHLNQQDVENSVQNEFDYKRLQIDVCIN